MNVVAVDSFHSCMLIIRQETNELWKMRVENEESTD